ncbi:hypothetical protein M8C13_07230 [Crossiella sp. SN42]|uniref:hypothetical protein n=1 Tax=Crossiella sp. SN42 TaxID=2944808 RepID=UPI00207D4C75|nr:hypothetical protein [Crossiella sp. SN42]MCO1575549.1 hypothetical protein [Crossiella sp. SN42]
MTSAAVPPMPARRGPRRVYSGTLDQARDELVAHLRNRVGPDLTEQAAQEMLTVAGLTGPQTLRPLVEHFRLQATALIAPARDCPASLVRLLLALDAAGHGAAVTLPACAECGRTGVRLPRTSAAGRVCTACTDRGALRPCGHCGQPGPIVTRSADGVGTCRRCYRADPDRLRHCAGCGKLRVAARRTGPDSWLCQSCNPRPLHECSRCGTRAPAHAVDPGHGPVCRACYTQPPRTCGTCGRQRPIARRATDDQADICVDCYRGRIDQCSVCLRVRTNVSRLRGGDLICTNCRPRTPRTCGLCGSRRAVKANWPVGAVCSHCYDTATRAPAVCARCDTTRVLVGRTEDSERLCGPCCGVDIDFSCRTCAHPGDIYAEGRCARCVVDDRVTDLLSHPGQPVAPELLPLADAFVRARHPRSVIGWLRTSPTARLLAGLVEQHATIDHDTLDALPPHRNVDFLRAMLVATGILPPRKEQLAKLRPWLDSVFTDLPARHLGYLRPFAEWEVLRIARSQAARRRYTAGSAANDRCEIRVAIEFLAWLDGHHRDLPSTTQADVDLWLTTGPSNRRKLRAFLRWTSARKITTTLTIADRSRALPTRFLDEEDHIEQLRRCLTDSSLPTELRVAAALIRLYAMPLTRVVELTTDHYRRDGNDAFLILGKNPVILPPSLGVLVEQQLARHQPGLVPGRTHYLLPGAVPGRPTRPEHLARQLARRDLGTAAAHNTAMSMLVADLPAVIVSDMIGISIKTANQWLGYASISWTDYLAARMEE